MSTIGSTFVMIGSGSLPKPRKRGNRIAVLHLVYSLIVLGAVSLGATNHPGKPRGCFTTYSATVNDSELLTVAHVPKDATPA